MTKNMMFPAASDMKLPGLLSFDSEDVANLLLALARDPGALIRVSAGVRSAMITAAMMLTSEGDYRSFWQPC